jgi:hypothetical protein
MDELVDVVGLIRPVGHTVRSLDAALPAPMHDLHALSGTPQRNCVHHAAARRAPVPRHLVDVQRRQAMRTVISVTAVRQRLHVRLADNARETAVLLASAHVPTPWCRSCRAPRSWVPFPLVAPPLRCGGVAWATSRLAATRGLFTAFAITSGSCFTAITRGSEPRPRTDGPLSGSFRHLPPVGVCRAHWHRRRPQIRRGRSAEPCLSSHLLVRT